MFVLSLSLPIQTWLSIKLSWLWTHSLNKSIFFFFIINAFSVATIWTPNEQVWNHLESGFGIRGNLKLLTPSFSERRNITAHSQMASWPLTSHRAGQALYLLMISTTKPLLSQLLVMAQEHTNHPFPARAPISKRLCFQWQSRFIHSHDASSVYSGLCS